MTNETEKAGATPRTDAAQEAFETMASFQDPWEFARTLESELSALRASQQAPVEGLPSSCPETATFCIDCKRLDGHYAFHNQVKGMQKVELHPIGTAARLAALENKEK